jgi:glycine betaine/proline transport system substrate-binding protein
VARRGLTADCPNLGKLLGQVTFEVGIENAIMEAMADRGTSARDAARTELKKRPELVKAWLAGVETLDGKPGAEAVLGKL